MSYRAKEIGHGMIDGNGAQGDEQETECCEHSLWADKGFHEFHRWAYI